MTTKAREEGADTIIIGVDYHLSFQTFFVEETCECGELELNDSDIAIVSGHMLNSLAEIREPTSS